MRVFCINSSVVCILFNVEYCCASAVVHSSRFSFFYILFLLLAVRFGILQLQQSAYFLRLYRYYCYHIPLTSFHVTTQYHMYEYMFYIVTHNKIIFETIIFKSVQSVKSLMMNFLYRSLSVRSFAKLQDLAFGRKTRRPFSGTKHGCFSWMRGSLKMLIWLNRCQVGEANRKCTQIKRWNIIFFAIYCWSVRIY